MLPRDQTHQLPESAALLVDGGGIITWVSEQVCAIVGRRAENLVGLPLAGLFSQRILQTQPSGSSGELPEQQCCTQEADRLQGKFLANLSHSLRTPLNGIIGFAQLLLDGVAGPMTVQHQEFLADILTSAQQLQELINDILVLNGCRKGEQGLHPEPMDLDRKTAEVCEPPSSTRQVSDRM
jgi:signal transduction histidine kinase